MLGMVRKVFAGEPAKVHQPVFIVGCGRSGTTLLFEILSEHPDLVRTTGYPDGEDHEGWIRYGKCVMAGIGNVHHSHYGNGINGQQFCLHMTREDVTEDIIGDMHNYYWENILEKRGGKRVLNKQPHLSNKLDYVLGIFPDAKILHIIRDCEPMVASWLSVMDDHPSLVVYWPKGEALPCFWLIPKPSNAVALARLDRHEQFFPGGGSALWIDYWCNVNVGIERQMQGKTDQLLTIRYEDLLRKPNEILARITSFCGLRDHAFQIGQFQQNTAQKHAHRITESLRRAIADQANSVRAKFGYLTGDVGALFPESLYIP